MPDVRVLTGCSQPSRCANDAACKTQQASLLVAQLLTRVTSPSTLPRLVLPFLWLQTVALIKEFMNANRAMLLQR